MTLIVVTHEMRSAFAIADRLALMHEGHFRIVDEPEVVRECTDPVVRRFLDRTPAESGDSAVRFERFLEDLEP